MDNQIPRDFKGIWIPRNVWLDNRLTYFEKCLLSELHSLDGEDGCFASNEYLCNFFNERERKIQDALSKLKKLKYIYVESFDGRTRVLKTDLNPNKQNLAPQDKEKPKHNKQNLAPLGCQIPHPCDVEIRTSPTGTHTILENNRDNMICSESRCENKQIIRHSEKKHNSKKQIIEWFIKDIFRRSLTENPDWKSEEIEEAWDSFAKTNGPINDAYAMISAIIKNNRIKKVKNDKQNLKKENKTYKEFSEEERKEELKKAREAIVKNGNLYDNLKKDKKRE